MINQDEETRLIEEDRLTDFFWQSAPYEPWSETWDTFIKRKDHYVAEKIRIIEARGFTLDPVSGLYKRGAE